MPIGFQLLPTYDADVIVVGAGPAGAAAGFRLAKAGVDVLLLDHASFPRDKVCGDFVGPGSLAELADMGVTARPEFQATNRTVGASVFLDGQPLITHHLPAADGLPSFGRVIPRIELDDWTRQAAVFAGARFRDRTKVSSVTVGPESMIVEAIEDDRRRGCGPVW